MNSAGNLLCLFGIIQDYAQKNTKKHFLMTFPLLLTPPDFSGIFVLNRQGNNSNFFFKLSYFLLNANKITKNIICQHIIFFKFLFQKWISWFLSWQCWLKLSLLPITYPNSKTYNFYTFWEILPRVNVCSSPFSMIQNSL